MIVATHSPVAISEIFSSNVFVIRRNGEITRVSHPSIETYGESIQEISNELFRYEISNTGYFSFLKNKVDSGLTYNQILELLNNNLGEYGKCVLAVLINNKDGKN